MKKKGNAVPNVLKGIITKSTLKKSQSYIIEKARFGILESVCGDIAVFVLFFTGLLNIYNSWMDNQKISFIFKGFFYFIILSYCFSFFNIPFQLYSIFKIENKFGFNTMKFPLWISDFIKTLIIETILMAVLIMAALWIVQLSPHFWWLFLWIFFFIFSMFIMYISPYILDPLFNKYTPIKDTVFAEKIKKLFKKTGIKVSQVFKVDASRRSRHSNAYFTGIGRVKRIVIYDTLLEKLNHEEILAVLAHEAGHWKKKHVLKAIISYEIFSFAALYISFLLLQGSILTSIFKILADNFFVKVIILGFLGSLLAFFFTPLSAYFSRRHENQADKYGVEIMGGSKNLASSLVKLAKDNLSNLYPHPFYVLFHYSHPPLLQRLESLAAYSKRQKKGIK